MELQKGENAAVFRIPEKKKEGRFLAKKAELLEPGAVEMRSRKGFHSEGKGNCGKLRWKGKQ